MNIEYSVSEISALLKKYVEGKFPYVRIKGEISGLKRAASGHLYLDIKDDTAVLNAVCWRNTAARLKCQPADGMDIIATGKITTYPARSNYQLIIEQIEAAGEGALMMKLEQLKKKLAAEGLFAASRKKDLPKMPQTIGVITSPTGAVIRDILHRISERFPVRVIIWPVPVQGKGAEQHIAAAINGFNKFPVKTTDNKTIPKPDILIVARGGGSLEDLWCFNEEIVVRAAANSNIPLISAVGHETDTTLIDYAADLRAPTPTAAAEKAVPIRNELLDYVTEANLRMHRAISRTIELRKQYLEGLARGLPRPKEILRYNEQRLDDISERLTIAIQRTIANKQHQLTVITSAITVPKHRLEQMQQKIEELSKRLNMAIKTQLDRKIYELTSITRIIESLSYQNTLKRGFTLLRSDDNRLITAKANLPKEGSAYLQFHDGTQKVNW